DSVLMTNLQQNSHQLLTHFDTHATFVDILETFSSNRTLNFSETVQKSDLNGTSLLRLLPDGPRNCKTLPIHPQYCLCEISKQRVRAE
ncbi:hypothetical protein PENTCL1PPCAC_15053, partial [Pristionchus entomophagus]